ncbi:MAG: methylase, partial [Ruminococcus sp.]|nr:methylase [Ruminococcus sp.]
SYIMGNPPFVGQSLRSPSQSAEMALIFGQGSPETKLDYVLCWYKKALDYINSINKLIKVAFVSTNSICQGESVPTFWKRMSDNGAEIQFAHNSFIWDSEANQKAHVHCVIVGFSKVNKNSEKILFNGGKVIKTSHINGYLVNAPDIWITNRVNISSNKRPKMTTGSPPTDDGGLLLTREEKEILETKYPILKKYIKAFIGAREFLHDKTGTFSRYCLWFVNANPADYNNIKEIKDRLLKIRNLRLKSKADRIQKMADYPFLFCQNRQPETNYLVFPRHSSEKRKYIPIGFMSPDIVAGDACSIIPDISIYEFGVLTSNVHMAWTKIVCGRLKSDYRYSPAVYNNFPFPKPTSEQAKKIELTAQGILDARNLYPECSLADLYDELTMPPELRKAHQKNDLAVMEAYGFDRKITESECVAELMKLYQKLTGGK